MKATIACLALVLLAGPAQGVDRDQWLHVAVDGRGGNDERVRVNLPLSIVETVLPLIETKELRDGKVWIDQQDLSHQDIVKILASIRDAKDGEYVTVDDLNESVRIAKEGNYLTVHFEDHGEKGEIRVPVSVLDALVSGEDDELDLLAAVRALGEADDQTLVTVEEIDTTVRIWIDRKNESD
jgi:hypothetical protein